MKVLEVQYNFSENGLIHGYKWFDDSLTKHKGIVILVHGMAEHIERYKPFAQLLAKNGYVVYGNNQRGHKDTSSKEDYGYMSDIDCLKILVNDVLETRNQVHQEYPSLPIFIFSHSMGSFVTQRYIELYGDTVNGCILCGSAQQPGFIVTGGHIVSSIICAFKGRRHRSKFLDKLSFGSYNKNFKPNRTANDWLNRDEREVDKYNDDEYCGGLFTVAYFKDFTAHLRDVNKNYHLIPKNLPILIVSGSDDPVGGLGKYVNKLYETLTAKQGINDVQIKLFEGARHELLLELCGKEAMNTCLEWLNSHLK